MKFYFLKNPVTGLCAVFAATLLKNVAVLERAQWRFSRMVAGLEHFSYGETLNKLGLFPLEPED